MSGTASRPPGVPPPWFVHTAWRAHRALHRLSGGRFLWTPSTKRGWGALRLTTVGRKSGRERTVIVGYLEDGADLVALAMNGWDEGHPAWWLNLEAHPDAVVRLAGEDPRPVRARLATGEERDRLWQRWSAINADLDAYAGRRSTETPVVVLEPSGDVAGASAYRTAERALWASVRREPTERTIRLAGTGTSVRVLQVGEGPPVLFLHGSPNAGSTWAPMLEHFHGYRCLLLDRPGTGLSETYSVRAAGLPELGARFVGDVLDGLGLERASVVASSFGGHLALRSAAAHPERIAAMVQMAAPALVPEATYPPFLKMMSSRILRRMVRALPPNEKAARMVLRQLGHGASLDAGRISPALLDWNMALQAHTDTLENDGAMIGDLLPRREDVVLTAGLLGAVRTPTLFLWGADDTFGREDNARLVSGLVPGAELVMMPAAGHLPWLDDPAFVAAQTAAFLTRHGEPAKDGA